MKKVGKIKAVNSSFNSWEKDGTTFHPHLYTFEDGTEIKANHKQVNPFKVGDEVEYEIKGNEPSGTAKGSVGKPQVSQFSGNSGGMDTSDSIIFQVCLKISADLFSGGNSTPSAEVLVNYAFDLAKESKLKIRELKNI